MPDNDIINNPIVRGITEDIVRICDPFRIFFVSGKTDKKGELVSFKVCAVVKDSYTDLSALESEILLSTDCPIPCDVIAYNVSDWNECLDDDCTFASRIDNEGVILYEQTKQPHI
jgi:hypothetical protein